MKKLNCWEFNKGGEACDSCPARHDLSYDDINSGKNGGRVCWAVSGTCCKSDSEGNYKDKRSQCMACDFYKLVVKEEGKENKNKGFLRYIQHDSTNFQIKDLEMRSIPAGTRFIHQNEIEKLAFIIQKGTCIALVEKDNMLHPVAHYGEGDIVGGLGIITDEPRLVHVEAETDMLVWVLEQHQFKNISEDDPEILEFLSGLVEDRFHANRPVAYRKIGRYLATEIIGVGGYSFVYKGMNTFINLPVAIKALKYSLAFNTDFRKTFSNEAKIVATFNHENIIRVYDIEERYRTIFIIMEHLDGETLEFYIERKTKIPIEETIHILAQVAAALDYAHKRGLIHRDIKPSNIILMKDLKVKLIDFGVACPPETDDFYIGGILHFNAPELFDDDASVQTDIYALGMTAYEMVTGGEIPFKEKKPGKLIKEIQKERDKLIEEDRKDIPAEMIKFINKACMKDLEKRFTDMEEVLFALELLKRSYEGPSTTDNQGIGDMHITIPCTMENQDYILNEIATLKTKLAKVKSDLIINH